MSEATGRLTARLASENITEPDGTYPYGEVTIDADYNTKLALDGTKPAVPTVTVEALNIRVQYQDGGDPFGFVPPGTLPLTVDGARALWAALGHALAEVTDDE